MANSPAKEDKIEDNDIEKNAAEVHEIAAANDDVDQNRQQTNPSTRRHYSLMKSTTFGVENANMQNLVSQINKDRKRADEAAQPDE